MATLKILVGTMTGTAQLVAEEIETTLKAQGHGVDILAMDDLDASVFAAGGHFVICTSTYGSGDVPDNARDFYEALCGTRPDLRAVRYAVFGLGDSTYPQTYNFGGKKFEALLGELGATRFFESHFHNASGGTLPEEECLEWAARLGQSLFEVVV